MRRSFGGIERQESSGPVSLSSKRGKGILAQELTLHEVSREQDSENHGKVP